MQPVSALTGSFLGLTFIQRAARRRGSTSLSWTTTAHGGSAATSVAHCEANAFLFGVCIDSGPDISADDRHVQRQDSVVAGEVDVEDRSEALPISMTLLQHVAASLPALMAAHSGLFATPILVAPACMPLPVLFSVPPVSSDDWLANKRARAFHRSCTVCVYAQGAFALMKLARGDLVGG
eukprot:CAMPEP_0115521508 /NCGR_PEP_ID=MMETSP0271-20121206/79584_1 /TAXON_ID=71861 /ORGANISM="Scrippsiella trochoidea, Strain CCMP3099" /LENGTH=179 /DNA_ID=CAMNT_0002952745 /DNA_START=66 /DNA_END=601 /DNA_ORIENTATION=+